MSHPKGGQRSKSILCPGRFVYLHQARHQEMLDADSRPCRAYIKIHPHPPLRKEGISPLFLKEGAGEIASGVVSFKQYIFLN